MTGGLIDAKQAGQLLGVPATWVLDQARHDRIPHVRLGRYVRFDPDALLDWARGRMRGPIYPAGRQPGGGGDAPTSPRPTPNR